MENFFPALSHNDDDDDSNENEMKVFMLNGQSLPDCDCDAEDWMK